MKKIIITGAGAAGMMAAIAASENENQVILLEKNDKPGKKLYITGKGRCNLTNDCEEEDFFKNVKRNSRFLYSAYSAFGSRETMDYFRQIGLKIKTERGNRVFPVSDKSSDVIRVLEEKLKAKGVEIRYNTTVKSILTEKGTVTGVTLNQGNLKADACIIATGGLSYASTGSTGDGYRIAKALGHSVTELAPSLVALVMKEQDICELEGLSLKNVELTVEGTVTKKEKKSRKVLFRELGEMLFTKNGISGPLVLSASSILAPGGFEEVELYIDLKPGLTEEVLEARVKRDFTENINKQFRNSLGELLPGRMADYIIKHSKIDPFCQVNSITQTERKRLCGLLKKLPFHFERAGGYNEAVITCGGVQVKEINPATMESKLVKGLYFAGEVLDVDALTGGYNLQIAWTTGYAAGSSAGKEE